jgi:hypothetical protein
MWEHFRKKSINMVNTHIDGDDFNVILRAVSALPLCANMMVGIYSPDRSF